MISVSVPKEIIDYKEKVIFGLSLRQLVCGVIAVGLAVATGLLLVQVLGLSIDIAGYCSFEEQRIVVRSGLSQVQTAKTVLHEITHAILHNEGDAKTRAEKELEAESAAFVICSHYGIDTSEYTFPYLASWCRQERDKLERCLDAIQKHAFSVIEQLDASMLELERAKADRGSLQQRLELAQAQSAIDLTRNPPSQVRNMELER